MEMNLVYIYDVVAQERPDVTLTTPSNLILPPIVVNNLGWSRGYWEIVASEPIGHDDTLSQHRFVRYKGTSIYDYDIVDESGRPVKDRVPWKKIDPQKLSQSGFSNFNHVDWQIRQILQQRGLRLTNASG